MVSDPFPCRCQRLRTAFPGGEDMSWGTVTVAVFAVVIPPLLATTTVIVYFLPSVSFPFLQASSITVLPNVKLLYSYFPYSSFTDMETDLISEPLASTPPPIVTGTIL